MATFTEARRTGSYILSEANGTRSREDLVIASGAGVLEPGTVLGKITAVGANQGKYAPYDDTADDGTEAAAAILYQAVDATATDAKAVGHVRDCEVAELRLVGIDAAAKVDLAALGVLVRSAE
ncbi:head decoration protein [Thauera aromatica]|uniref:head decoration protein n=1 Tax=Thauera aromatica TaxID=59405 RepID=UPI001FFD5F6F|nr:head decoration protein [Thauera aromatica]MCK2095225.1 head decoration protein [Thauera aromatica]